MHMIGMEAKRVALSIAVCGALVHVLMHESGAATPQAETEISFLNRGVGRAYREFAVEWNAPRSPLGLDADTTDLKSPLWTCAELLALAEKHGIPEEVKEQFEFNNYAGCYALVALAYATKPKVELFDLSQLGLDLFLHFDVGGMRTRRESYSLSQKPFSYEDPEAPGGVITVADRWVLVEEKYWRTEIEAVAAADFNGEGREELLVSFWDRSLDSRLENQRYVIVSRTEKDGPMTIHPVDLRAPPASLLRPSMPVPEEPRKEER